MFANFATAIPTGAAVTFMLLFAMQSLIALQPGIAADISIGHELIFLREIPQEDLIKEEFPPVDPIEPLDPPLREQPEHYPSGDPVFTIPSTPATPTGPRSALNNPFTNDGPLMAIVRVEPTYPAVAASRGLEGYVVVQFDVLSDGSVGNISVLRSSSSVFERSAMQAASRFRFKARVVDGVPQTSTGVRYQFRFKMDN